MHGSSRRMSAFVSTVRACRLMYLYHSLLSLTATMRMERHGLKRNVQDFGRYEPVLHRNCVNEIYFSIAAAATIVVIALSLCPDCTRFYLLHSIPPSRLLLLVFFAFSHSLVAASAVHADTDLFLVVWDCQIMG